MTLTANPCRPLWARIPVIFIVALAIIAALAGERTSAEPEPRLVSMAVSVMPEYDKPSVFVSYRGDLNEDVATPLKVRVRIPAGATIDHACSLKPENEHVCHPYTTEPDGEWSTLSYEAVTNVLYIEYHYGSVSGAGARDLDFNLWPPYPVETLDLFVQEPAQATDFVLTPAEAEVMGDQQEFRHHSYNFQNVTTDQPVTIKMQYTRPTDEPSVEPEAEASAETVAEERGGVSQTLVLALGLAGAGVLGLVLYLALSGRLRAVPLPIFRRKAAAARAEATETAFCRHCGQRIRPGAAFCAACGQASQSPGGGLP